ncbi:MAG: hypothetical protein NC218_05715 [Acetobacter sp.]|nr:hypothetical protein [Acetobacter sp.]
MKNISALIKFFSLSFFILLVCAAGAFADDACPSLKTYKDNGIGDKFILKGAFELIADACTKVANFSWKTFAKPLQAIVGLGTAIYIALYTLKNIGSFSQQDTSAYLSNDKTGVIPLAVKMTIVVWLLGNQAFLYKYLIGMAITTGMEVGTLIGYTPLAQSFSSPDNLGTLFHLVIKQIIIFNNTIYKIVATGQLLLCMAFSPDNFLKDYWVVVPIGGALYIYGWLLIIGVSFYMLDVLFRLGVGCIFLPFAVACGMSKLTSVYTKKAWNLFMNVCFNFVMLGIVITFTDLMIQKCIGINIPEDKIFNEADIKDTIQNIGLKSFVVTSICCMITYQLFMQVEQLVEKISGADSVGKVGSEIGSKVSQAALHAVKAPIKEVGNITAASAQEVGATVSSGINNKYQRFKAYVQTRPSYQYVSNSRVGRGYRTISRWNQAVRRALRLDE